MNAIKFETIGGGKEARARIVVKNSMGESFIEMYNQELKNDRLRNNFTLIHLTDENIEELKKFFNQL